MSGTSPQQESYDKIFTNMPSAFRENLINSVKIGDLENVQRTYMDMYNIVKSQIENITPKKDKYIRHQIINYHREKDGRTALHMAYAFKYIDIIKFLIDNGGLITLKDNEGDTPVRYMMSVGVKPADIDILEYTITIPKLAPEDGKEIATLLNSMLPTDKYKRLGMGTYGLVVAPGFQINDERKDKTVTKFMFNGKEYKDTLKTKEKIKRNLPLLNTLTEPYEKEYVFSNIATNNAQVAKILKALKPSIKNTNQIYPILMENLGKSFYTLNDEDIPAIAAIPIKTILEQYKKLADTIAQLKEKRYIHGDIRETNIVLNLETGKITIIDFDWLLNVTEFINRYEFQFYCHPPELIFTKEKRYFYYTEFKKNLNVGQYKDVIEERLKIIGNVYTPYDVIHHDDEIYNGVRESMYTKAGIKETNDNTKMLPYDYAKNIHTMLANSYLQIDSYGLGYSLSYFHKILEKTKPLRNPKEWALIDKLKIMVHSLCDTSYLKRMRIEEFQQFIKSEQMKKYGNQTLKKPKPFISKLTRINELANNNANANVNVNVNANTRGGYRKVKTLKHHNRRRRTLKNMTRKV